MSEKRDCPKCGTAHDIEPILASRDWHIKCQCGAELELEWERIETQDGPEDCYYFEEPNAKLSNPDSAE